MTVGLAMIVLLAATLFFIPRLSTTASAAWSGTAAESITGSGTQDDPYQISSGEELAWIAKQVNENGETFAGEYFVLTADIDLDGKEWTPISFSGYDNNYNPTKVTDFAGTLDGQKFTIRSPLKTSCERKCAVRTIFVCQQAKFMMRRRPCRRPVISLCNIVLHLLVRHTALLRRLS